MMNEPNENLARMVHTVKPDKIMPLNVQAALQPQILAAHTASRLAMTYKLKLAIGGIATVHRISVLFRLADEIVL
jgi:hypothetical protein